MLSTLGHTRRRPLLTVSAQSRHATSVANARPRYFSYSPESCRWSQATLLSVLGICQYSSREPRTRGPSKARLRNAVSSSDLRTSFAPSNHFSATGALAKPQQYHASHSSQGYSPTNSNGVRPGSYPGLRRVASIPRTHYNSHQPLRKDSVPTPTSATSYESWRDPSSASSPFPFDDGPFPSPFQMPSVHFGPGSTPPISQWRDVRRVQSHSTLIGSPAIDMKKSFNYGMRSPLPNLNGGDFLGSVPSLSHPVSSMQGRHSPDFMGTMPSFNSLHSFEPHSAPALHTSDTYPWA
jgi:hypothetical protein